ncbi:MAG: hypothetical protein U1A78_37530 [Polyangia bacterium]
MRYFVLKHLQKQITFGVSMHSSSAESTIQSQLRQAVTDIEQRLELLSLSDQTAPARASLAELRTSFSTLVRLLALGPEPEVRACPACGHTVMRAAKLCGYCWTPLLPVAEADADAAPLGPAAEGAPAAGSAPG